MWTINNYCPRRALMCPLRGVCVCAHVHSTTFVCTTFSIWDSRTKLQERFPGTQCRSSHEDQEVLMYSSVCSALSSLAHSRHWGEPSAEWRKECIYKTPTLRTWSTVTPQPDHICSAVHVSKGPGADVTRHACNEVRTPGYITAPRFCFKAIKHLPLGCLHLKLPFHFLAVSCRPLNWGQMVSHGPFCIPKTPLPGGWMGRSLQHCGRGKVVPISLL